MLKWTLAALFFLALTPQAIAAGNYETHPHHVAVFIGGSDTEVDGSGFTIGLDYEYRLSKLFGVGAMVEYADIDHSAWIIGVPFVLHPWKGLRLQAMPGVEFIDDHSNFLFRAGIGYDIPVGDWSLTPSFNVDFVSGHENLIFGVAIGRSF